MNNNSIVLPKKVEFIKGKEKNQGQVVVEPCYPGYGTTLGNSLRRVLLSSLPGAAVVGAKIKGADHEFSTLPNVKEDVLEIILNLKQVRFKFFGEEDPAKSLRDNGASEKIKLELKVTGEKKVTAKDIAKNSKVEVVNSGLHIAEITDKSGSLEIEIFVAKGLGYSAIENREETEKEVGYIEIDSIFTPVKAVSVNIDNVRVGKMTNWEKLIVDITTDGTMDFTKAFKESVKILVDQFSFLLKPKGKVEEKTKEDKAKEKNEKE